MGVRKVPVAGGLFAAVDAIDYDMLACHRWSALRTSGRIYAVRHEKGRTVLMHRVLVPGAVVVDHIDGDGLNNVRTNLRPATRSQNSAWSLKDRGGSSRFRGVYFNRAKQKWQAQISHRSMNSPSSVKFLGRFDSEEDAARAYNSAAAARWGEFAVLNPVDGWCKPEGWPGPGAAIRAELVRQGWTPA